MRWYKLEDEGMTYLIESIGRDLAHLHDQALVFVCAVSVGVGTLVGGSDWGILLSDHLVGRLARTAAALVLELLDFTRESVHLLPEASLFLVLVTAVHCV